ncbi:MAG: dephospho-CoA kinase [Smithella sp.]|jgi:dephospho-CoA kinase
MLNVGLTGGIACGKSTVAQMFVRLGGHLIDFDKLAHEVQEPGKPAWQDVVHCFGREVLQPDQKIDRNKLAAVVFNHPDKLQALNDIIHPRVYEAWRFRLEEINKHHPHAIVFADVPLLFEGRMQHLFDLTILVMIEPEEQVNRLMNRSALCRSEAELRLSCQMPIGEKMNLADIIIDNRCAMNETEKKVAEVWQHLLEREKNQKHRKTDSGGKPESVNKYHSDRR